MTSTQSCFAVRILCCLVLLLAGVPLCAQTTAPSPTPESLLIGPGDMLHVQVFDEPELEERARVSDAGDFRLRLGGTVHVGGLSTAQAAGVIQTALTEKAYLLHPSVTVGLEEFTAEKVTVIGDVKTPGVFAIPTTSSVLDLIALAGGLNVTADRRITIQRRGSGARESYYLSNDANQALADNFKVNPGDRLFVSRAPIIYVLGDVKTPGGYAMSDNEGSLSVLELVARAGGTLPSAAQNHTTLLRRSSGNPTPEPVELSKMEKGKIADEALKPGDIIYVPFSYVRNALINIGDILVAVGSAAIYRF